MGRRRVELLREQFQQQGFVEFGISPFKVALHLLLYVLLGGMFLGMGVALGPIGIAVMSLLVLYLWSALGWIFSEQAFGPPPALRFDRAGITLRRRGGAVTVPWSDGPTVEVISNNAWRLMPQVRLQLTSDAWSHYLQRQPRFDRFLRKKSYGFVTLFKIFDAPAKDVVQVVDADFLDSMGVAAEGQRLLQDYKRNPDDPKFQLSETDRASVDDAIALVARQKEQEKQAAREGRALTAEEKAELDAAWQELALRNEGLPSDEG